MDESTKLDSPKRDYKTLSNVENDKHEGLNKQEVFSEIEMEYVSEAGKNKTQENNEAESENKKTKRVPRRVIHFSDGIVEEFSTDSEDEEEKRKSALIEEEKKKYALLDPKKLNWVPWMVWHTWFMGSTVLSYCDFIGEKLAWWFGITSPKYYYELEEFKRMQEEEKEAEEKRKIDEHGWTNVASSEVVTTSTSGQTPSKQSRSELKGLDPKELQQSHSWNSEAQRKNIEVAVQQELHTVDFDPESQTKHY